MATRNNRKLFIFDFDGTLVDSHLHLVAIYNQFTIDHPWLKLNPVPAQLAAFREKNLAQLSNALNMGWLKFTLTSPWIRRRAIAGYNTSMQNRPVLSVIAALKADGHYVALVTSNDQRAVSRALAGNVSLDIVFDKCFFYKKTWAIRRCVRLFAVQPEDSFYIGDESRDIIAARRAGVRAVAVTWGVQSINLLSQQHPDFTLHNAEQLRTLLS